VAAQLNALQRHHRGHLVEIARILNAMTPEQHASLGIREWDPAEAYDRVGATVRQLVQGARRATGSSTASRWTPPGLPTGSWPLPSRRSFGRLRRWPSMAPNLETWGALHGDSSTVGVGWRRRRATQLVEEPASEAQGGAKRLGWLDVGKRRNASSTPLIRTLRAGQPFPPRTVDRRGPYVGLRAPPGPCRPGTFGGTNGIDRTSLGTGGGWRGGVRHDVSRWFPAGTHRGRAVVNDLLEAERRW